MGASVEILEIVHYYYPLVSGIIAGVLLVIIAILFLYGIIRRISCNKYVKTQFIVFFLAVFFATLCLTCSINRDSSMFGLKTQYTEYTIMFTDNTNYRYLIEHFDFLEKVYSNIWRVTERRS